MAFGRGGPPVDKKKKKKKKKKNNTVDPECLLKSWKIEIIEIEKL